MSDVRSHALLMITAWMFCASLGLIIARFYRNLPGSLIGQKIWFIVHTTLMSLTLILTAAAFILIFVYAKWVWMNIPGYMGAHPFIGTTVFACVVLNPIMAIFRPKVTSRNRVFYNWIHWVTGRSAFILAFINIFIGLDLYGVKGTVWWLILALAIVYYVTEVVVDKLYLEHDKLPTGSELLGGMNDSDSDVDFSGKLHPGKKTSMFLYGVLGVYVVTMLSLWIAVLVMFP